MSLHEKIISVVVYIAMLALSLYFVGHGVHGGLIKKRIMMLKGQTKTYLTGGTAIGIGIGFIIAGALGLYACWGYVADVWQILRSFV